MKILLTGASGFIGQGLRVEMSKRGLAVRYAIRSPKSTKKKIISNSDEVVIGNISANTNWSESLIDIKCIIHCAARAHIMNETDSDSLTAYRKVNVDGTRNLAEQAAMMGVKRFIFLSTIGVNGDFTSRLKSFTHKDKPAPTANYAISKWEAEQVLKKISIRTGLEVVIIRPTLVYGPGVKGNFLRLLNLIKQGFPLPLGSIDNRRSFVGLDNLVDLIITCVDHIKAPGQTFLISDGIDLSTPDLIRKLENSMGKSSRLFPIPISILNFIGLISGRHRDVERLVHSLQVDYSHTKDLLDWKPIQSFENGLLEMIKSYLKTLKRK
ncbi:NAD-dependent epimerase/dehydratase family protein [Pelagibacterales bacterium]|nr:NAD-dependent epimerase/dehydratase family protein [Pelagibacterales bacterium]